MFLCVCVCVCQHKSRRSRLSISIFRCQLCATIVLVKFSLVRQTTIKIGCYRAAQRTGLGKIGFLQSSFYEVMWSSLWHFRNTRFRSGVAAVQRVNLNTEKANNTEVVSARRMKGKSAEISILKPQYTGIWFMKAHLLMTFIVVLSFCLIIADNKIWDSFHWK